MFVSLGYFYPHEEDNLEMLEALYNVAAQQQQDLSLTVMDRKFFFPLGMERETRIRKFKKIIRESKPP